MRSHSCSFSTSYSANIDSLLLCMQRHIYEYQCLLFLSYTVAWEVVVEPSQGGLRRPQITRVSIRLSIRHSREVSQFGDIRLAEDYQPLATEPSHNELVGDKFLIYLYSPWAHFKQPDPTDQIPTEGNLPPLTTKETARLALIFCFFWFVANWAVNASLDYTSVASATVLSSMSGAFPLSTHITPNGAPLRLLHSWNRSFISSGKVDNHQGGSCVYEVGPNCSAVLSLPFN